MWTRRWEGLCGRGGCGGWQGLCGLDNMTFKPIKQYTYMHEYIDIYKSCCIRQNT